MLWKPRFLHLALIYMLIQMSVYGVVFFLPSQVGALIGARVGFVVGLVSAIPWICALAATWFLPRFADRTGYRRETAAVALLVAALGIAASVAAGSAVLGLIGLCFAASGFIAAQPIFWSHASARLAGITAAAGIAFINSLGAVGAFVAPNIRVLAEALADSREAGLYTLAALTMLSAILMLLARADAPGSPVRR